MKAIGVNGSPRKQWNTAGKKKPPAPVSRRGGQSVREGRGYGPVVPKSFALAPVPSTVPLP
jgi:hypothetical protein